MQDPEFEDYLRQFHPVSPGPLRISSPAKGRWLLFAAPALASLASVGLFWFWAAHPTSTGEKNLSAKTDAGVQLTLGGTTPLTQLSSDDLDKTLENQSRLVLPKVSDPNAAFSELARPCKEELLK